MKYEFWKNWKRKSDQEKEYIEKLKKARELVINSMPKSKLVAIYVKGSFVRRELKKGSDIDIVPIVTDIRYQKNAFGCNTKEVNPPCIIVPLAISEFKKNKLLTKGDKLRARPDRFIKKLKYYKLIYGKPLNTKNFKVRSDEEAFKALLKVLQNVLIPRYESGKGRLSHVVKEFFWLTEDELKIRGLKVEHSFRDIAKKVPNSHPIKEAYKFRTKKLKGKMHEKRFILRLKKYLKELDKIIE